MDFLFSPFIDFTTLRALFYLLVIVLLKPPLYILHNRYLIQSPEKSICNCCFRESAVNVSDDLCVLVLRKLGSALDNALSAQARFTQTFHFDGGSEQQTSDLVT